MNNSTKKILLSVCFSAIVAGCSQQKSVDEYIAEAKSTLAAGEHKSAVIALKNGIQADPENAQVRFMLGELYLSLDMSVNAIKELERAKQYKFDNAKVLPLLAKAYYLNEDFQSLVDLSPEGLSEEALVQALYFKALAYTQLQQVDKSKAIIIQLSNLALSNGYRQIVEAYTAFQLQELERAKQLVEEALSILPAQPQGLLLLGHIGSASRDFNMAAENYKKYLELQPNQRSVELMLANALLLSANFEQAEKHADNILALVPNQAFANYVKAMVRAQAADYENANKYAEVAINNKFNQPNIRLVAGVSAFYLKKHEQSLNYLKPLLAYLPEDHFARKMVVVSQMELGLIEDAAETVDSLAESSKNTEEFYSAISYRLLQAGAVDEAKSVMAKQGASNADDANQLLKDGVLRMMLDDQSAMKSLEKAVELDPELVKAELALAFLAVKSGDINKAQTIAQKWQMQYPEKADGFQLEAAIAAQRKDLKLAEELLLKSLEVEPDNVASLTQLAQLAIRNQQIDKAKSFVSKAITINPNYIKSLRLYFDIYKNEQALNFVAETAKAAPENNGVKLAYAEALLKLKKIDDGLNVLNDIVPDAKTPKSYWMLKVYALKASGNKVLLKSTLDEWRKISPFHIEHHIYLAEYYIAEKSPESALKVIDEGLEKHKEHLALNLVKVQLLLDINRVAQAESLYQSFSQRVLGQPAQYGIEGRIALLNKDFFNAVENLTTFYQSQPSIRNVMYLTAALIANKQHREAVNLLEQHIAKFGGQPQLYSTLGSLQLGAGNRAEALSTYEQMAKEMPTNVVAINNVAWLYMEKGEFDKALDYANKAMKLAPEVPNVVDTLGQILLKSGKEREALTHAKKAYELSKGGDIDIALNYADVLITNKRNNQARQVLTNVPEGTNAQSSRKAELLAKINS